MVSIEHINKTLNTMGETFWVIMCLWLFWGFKPSLVLALGASHCPRRTSHLDSQTYGFLVAQAEAWRAPYYSRIKSSEALRSGKKRLSECGKMPGDPVFLRNIVLNLSALPNSTGQKLFFASFYQQRLRWRVILLPALSVNSWLVRISSF